MSRLAVARLREAKGMTQQELAVAAGLHMTTVYRVEAGAVEPSLSTLEALAAALGVTVADLLAEPAPVAERSAS